MSKNNKKNGTYIHGIGASEHLDSSGERIKVEGVDISSLTVDGVFNYEHNSDTPAQVVGKILEARKIMKEEDCENEHHRYFWDRLKMPYIYVGGELLDGVGHSGATDVASMLKYDEQGYDDPNIMPMVNFSIEGSRLEKRGSTINKCVARNITVTIKPCNKVAGAEIKKNESGEFDAVEFAKSISVQIKNDKHTKKLKKIRTYSNNMRKAIAASIGMGAPSTATQGDALGVLKKEELISFLSKKFPNKDQEFIISLADMTTRSYEKRKEEQLAKLMNKNYTKKGK